MNALAAPDDGPLGPEPTLALHYVPAVARAATALLWRLDARMAALFARTADPDLTAIKLAWWEEALAGLDAHGGHGEPLLGEIATVLLPLGVRSQALASLAGAWREEALEAYATRRAGLFTLSAELADAPLPPTALAAAEGWALAGRARQGIVNTDAACALAAARFAQAGPIRWPRGLRSLGALSVLARRDVANGPVREREASPARVARMLRVALTGFDN